MRERPMKRASEPFREHDPSHPYVQRFVGCGHGLPEDCPAPTKAQPIG